MRKTIQGVRFLFLGLLCSIVYAGGGPQNVLVVVNDNSANSQEIGQYYQELRGIPERNIFHISTHVSNSIDVAAYSNTIQNPIFTYIADSGLSNQIDYIVFSRDIPYRVFNGVYTTLQHSGLPPSMFYGFKFSPNALIPSNGCQIATGSAHDYFESERSFSHMESSSSGRYYIASMLVGANFNNNKAILERSVQADETAPTGTVYFLHTPDTARNVQWPQFENADFMARMLDIPQTRQILDANSVTGKTDILGYVVGDDFVSGVTNNVYVPGALADHLTSYGGIMFESSGQMPITDWIKAGASGSYGTCVEPCAFTNKFPQVRLHYWYGRGFNLGESYWMAVQNPYQGVFVGDPLCAPYAKPPAVAIYNVATNEVLSGTVSLSMTGTATYADQKVHRMDLFLDEVYIETLTNVTPRVFNEVTITINGNDYSHTVLPSQDLYDVATSLVALVNTLDTGVTARAFGDRIELKQDALGVEGASITYSASSSIGFASELTVHAVAVDTQFLETAYAAREEVTLQGTPATGDIVRAIVTRLDGAVITNEVVATTNLNTSFKLLSNLLAVVNANLDLQTNTGCEMKYLFAVSGSRTDASFVARTNTWESHNLFLDFIVITNTGSTLSNTSFSDNFNDNGDVLGARGTVFLQEGGDTISADYSLDTTALADGPHTLHVVAYEGSSLRTQGHQTMPFVVDNNSMTCSITNPVSGMNIARGSVVTAQVDATTGAGTVTQVSFYVEGKLYAQTNAAPYEFLWITTNHGAGVVGLQARAENDSGESVLSETENIIIYTDSDGDGVSDQWEYDHFGSASTYGGTNDVDGDGVSNRDEYLADTDPSDSAQFFYIQTTGSETNPSLQFVTSTTREYQVQYQDVSLTDTGWQENATPFFTGSNLLTAWIDDGTNAPPATNDARFYRIKARVP